MPMSYDLKMTGILVPSLLLSKLFCRKCSLHKHKGPLRLLANAGSKGYKIVVMGGGGGGGGGGALSEECG